MKRHKMIGLAAEGACLGRTGTLLWLQIALPNECFLFDMKTIGANSALTSGLKDVLESPAIQKVIHNCRTLSDYLHHKHDGLRIVNVFDTQVADILVYQNEHKGDLPRFVHSISQVVPVCVDLEVEEVYKARARAKTQAEDEMLFWGGPRPPTGEVVETAVFNVMYLLPLYHHLMDKLFEPLRKGVDVFLANLRDCSDHQYQMRKVSAQRIGSFRARH
jgi:exonuclease 3'-5' domain-containing protein 1